MFVIGEFVEEDGLGLHVQGHIQADLGQVFGHGFADLLIVDIAVVGSGHGDIEPVGVPGLGDHLLGQGRVVGEAFEPRQVTDGGDIRDLGRGRGLAVHDLGDDFVLVDGMGDGLTHPQIGEGRAGLVGHAHIDRPPGRPRNQFHVGHLLDAFDQGDGNAADDVGLLAGQGGEARGLFGDRADLHGLVLGRALPVVFVGGHADV